jgi:small subunit ribosomal protein S16
VLWVIKKQLSGLADGQASILRCNTAQDDSNTEKTKGYNMTMIRMTRMGRKKKPFYRIVVTDSRKRRDGGWIEAIGHYNPVSANKELTLDEERLNYWLSVGAQMSPTVKRLAGKK